MTQNKIIDTRNFTIITNTCNDAKNQSKMIAVIGYPGAGKTTALIHYYGQSPNTFYVKVQPSMKPKMFFMTRNSPIIFHSNSLIVNV